MWLGQRGVATNEHVDELGARKLSVRRLVRRSDGDWQAPEYAERQPGPRYGHLATHPSLSMSLAPLQHRH